MADKPRTQANNPTSKVMGQYWVALVSASYLAALLFITFPQIDLIVSAQFTAPESQGFPMARLPFLRFMNKLVPTLAWMVGGFVIIGLFFASTIKRPFMTLGVRQYWFLALSFSIGPGLIANTLLKNNWGRARPRDITQFGGTLDFAPPVLLSDQCLRNCSFVSGDASLAFTFLAVALILPKRRILSISAALLFGIIVSATRLIQGAHFFSDVLFAGLFMILTVISLHMIIIEKRGPGRKWFKSVMPGTTDAPHTRKSDRSRLTLKRALWLMYCARPEDLHINNTTDKRHKT